MAFKFLTFLALVAVARAGVIAPALTTYAAPAPITKTILAAAPALATKTIVADDEYDPNPQYSYSYGISDALTGDQKEQHESRNGDAVSGSYSLVDADGFKRTVEYTADPHHGFNAVVHREPLHAAKTVVAAAPAVVAAKTIIAQPAVAHYAAAPLATKTIVSQPALYHH